VRPLEGRIRWQGGMVLPLLAVAMVSLLAMSGLALDVGHLYLNRSRLQNGLDAAALAAADVLLASGSEQAARQRAEQLFREDIGSGLAALAATPVVEFSATLVPFVAATTPPQFVRVRVDALSIPLWLLPILPGVGEAVTLRGSAVAGPAPLAEVCDVVPLLVCAGSSACSASDCFGYPLNGDEQVLKTGAGNSGWEVGSGNFQLLSLSCGSGADCLRESLAGTYRSCLSLGASVTTKPGNSVGPVVQGINTRFGIYQGGLSSEEAPADLITATPLLYEDYLAAVAARSPEEAASPQVGRRLLTVVMADCSGTVNGAGEVSLLGFGCFFLTREAQQQGNEQQVYGQFLGACEASGIPLDRDQVWQSGGMLPYRVVLYKDPAGIGS